MSPRPASDGSARIAAWRSAAGPRRVPRRACEPGGPEG